MKQKLLCSSTTPAPRSFMHCLTSSKGTAVCLSHCLKFPLKWIWVHKVWWKTHGSVPLPSAAQGVIKYELIWATNCNLEQYRICDSQTFASSAAVNQLSNISCFHRTLMLHLKGRRRMLIFTGYLFFSCEFYYFHNYIHLVKTIYKLAMLDQNFHNKIVLYNQT